MEQEQLWQLVEQARQDSRDTLEAHIAGLSSVLETMTDEEIWAFCDAWELIFAKAYTYQIYLAINIVLQGECSDDRLDDCISSLMFYGEKVFEQVLSNPDSLAGINFQWCEEAATFIDDVWAERNPNEFMVSANPQPLEFQDIQEEELSEADLLNSLRKSFPKLCRKYGWPPSNAKEE